MAEEAIWKTYKTQIDEDWKPILKSVDEENLILEHFISSENVDRHGDIVRANGFKTMGMPGVLLGHNSQGETIGKSLELSVSEIKGIPAIVAKTQYFKDEQGERLFKKAKDDFMKWSIGFRPIKQDVIQDEKGNVTGRDFTEYELFEYSQVSVPANPDAGAVKSAEECVVKFAYAPEEKKEELKVEVKSEDIKELQDDVAFLMNKMQDILVMVKNYTDGDSKLKQKSNTLDLGTISGNVGLSVTDPSTILDVKSEKSKETELFQVGDIEVEDCKPTLADSLREAFKL